jgi:hypothetical protein
MAIGLLSIQSLVFGTVMPLFRKNNRLFRLFYPACNIEIISSPEESI